MSKKKSTLNLKDVVELLCIKPPNKFKCVISKNSVTSSAEYFAFIYPNKDSCKNPGVNRQIDSAI